MQKAKRIAGKVGTTAGLLAAGAFGAQTCSHYKNQRNADREQYRKDMEQQMQMNQANAGTNQQTGGTNQPTAGYDYNAPVELNSRKNQNPNDPKYKTIDLSDIPGYNRM